MMMARTPVAMVPVIRPTLWGGAANRDAESMLHACTEVTQESFSWWDFADNLIEHWAWEEMTHWIIHFWDAGSGNTFCLLPLTCFLSITFPNCIQHFFRFVFYGCILEYTCNYTYVFLLFEWCFKSHLSHNHKNPIIIQFLSCRHLINQITTPGFLPNTPCTSWILLSR